jgi:ATP-dependent DNA helicase UvrD/PcrA
MPFELTDEQRAVINHPPTKHGRVIAGPGTGKSATAVALAEHLLTSSEPPLRVKFLTFTRAATSELARKLATSQAGILERPSTIHSFAIATLLRNPGCASFPQPLRIPDKHEYKNLIRPHLARQTRVGLRRLDDLVREMSAKWESLNPQENPRVTLEERARFMGAWLQHRQVFGYTLLDELPDLLRVALRDHDDLNGIDYQILIVDEYQDLNACDLEVMNRLADRGISILAIGDDDQSIYSFRKAHPAGIRQFLRDFNTEHDYRLTVCHRSPQRIVEWAQFVIQGDTSREERPVPTCRTGGPEGVIALLRFRGNISEAKGVADLVKWLKDSQEVSPSEILILTRTDLHGTFTTPIKEELQQRNIPISDPDSIETMLSEVANRRLLSVLWLLVDCKDSRHGGLYYIFNLALEIRLFRIMFNAPFQLTRHLERPWLMPPPNNFLTVDQPCVPRQ